VLWINNEEKPSRLLLRLYNSVCGANRHEIASNTDHYKQQFAMENGHAIKLIDRATVSVYDLEGWIRLHKPKVVVIDQGDKVTYSGGKDKAQHDRLTELYQKFRELAKAYDIDIISVGQASGEAHGQKWPQLTHMNNSKTGKPGELDYAIGIGMEVKDTDNFVRYIHLCKNKLEDGAHGKHTVHMDPMLCTYTDL
jgi:ASC-1-like (ASCH) protein